MDRVVAFLRGMNLGGRRITNDELARHFADAGLGDPTPYQASGNVIFVPPADLGDPAAPHAPSAPGSVGGGHDALERHIERHLQAALGYPVDTFVRSLRELADMVAAEGLEAAEAEGFKIHVILLHEPTGDQVRGRLSDMETDDDRFLAPPTTGGGGAGREIYWLRRGRLSDSTIDASDPGSLTGGRTSTMRTLGTLRRIVKKFG